jgi:four helix bundle protein
MKYVLAQKSTDLALAIIRYYQWLREEKKEFVMSKQLLRSGTSIGANIREGYYAASRADFVNKMQTALKEAAESEYWLYLLEESGYFDPSFEQVKLMLDETKRILVSTIKTTKDNGI